MEESRGRGSLVLRSIRPRVDDVEARGAPVERKGETVWEGGVEETLLALMWTGGTEGVGVPVTSRLAFRSSGKRDVSVERRLSVVGLCGRRAGGWTLLWGQSAPGAVRAASGLWWWATAVVGCCCCCCCLD
jgi:hypothetical protein